MADKKMTTREFYKGVMGLFDEGSDNTIYEKASELLTKLDETNAKRKAAPKKPSKAAQENAPIAAAITEYLTGVEGNALAKDIAEAVGQSIQKTNAVLRALVDEGKVERIEVARSKPIEYKAVTAE